VIISAYKYYIGEKRSAWRNIYTIKNKEQNQKLMMNEIRSIYEESIIKACERFINLINNYIMKQLKGEEERALFIKTKADHYRYMAEITNSQVLFNNKQTAFQLYKQAHDLSSKFDDLNAIRLSIALNYSVFLFEILNKRTHAIFNAKDALTNALTKLKEISEQELAQDKYKECLTIIEILNENVHNWYEEEMETLKLEKIKNVELKTPRDENLENK
jgi:14-3-3 protein epsilon